MAFRRALSIRSTLTSLRKQLPSYHIIIRENNHAEDSFTSQRSYDSFLHHQLLLLQLVKLGLQRVTLSCLSRLFSIALIWFIHSLVLNTTKLSVSDEAAVESIREEMQSKGMDHVTMAEGQKKMKNLFKEYGVTPFTPMKGMLIQGPLFIFFFLAIRNMAEKVPSFQTGGALWFTDLTTPDSLYILHVITALAFLITVECNAQEGMEGNPMAGTVKNVCRGFALLTVPMTMSFPQAIFCYWITSNLFSLTYGLVIKRPRVKKLLKIPELPPPPPGQQPSFDLLQLSRK
ncbi:BnaA02g33120D [Brassica napus]|uniref:BnaA02g33120D protein n=1 Tax=Brassica napus TaxID=3708 RepID=A0A078GW42_BRANA|nr:BnaA02g33120D [Brassica napus]